MGFYDSVNGDYSLSIVIELKETTTYFSITQTHEYSPWVCAPMSQISHHFQKDDADFLFFLFLLSEPKENDE